MPHLYGLIGYPLSHSFSKRYFTQKFETERIPHSHYELFPLKNITELPELIAQHPDLRGLNVTIPYKQQVVPLLDELDSSARQVGAVNTIKIDAQTRKRTGYNTDYYGFKHSLENWLGDTSDIQALVLGTGGASKAVQSALKTIGIPYLIVSRTPSEQTVSYEPLKESHLLKDYRLIVNTTPLGMSPQTDTCPDLVYGQLSAQHYCYDLVYNPETTRFMQLAAAQGAKVKNGLEMLHLQAEKSWEIWNQA